MLDQFDYVSAAGGSHRKTDWKWEADESDVTDMGGEAAEYRWVVWCKWRVRSSMTEQWKLRVKFYIWGHDVFWPNSTVMSILCVYTERLQQERQQALEKMGISVQASGIKVEKNKYYLVNLNADPSLNELLVYYLKVFNSFYKFIPWNSRMPCLSGRASSLFTYDFSQAQVRDCPESIQPFGISQEPVTWPWCNLAASQTRPYCASVNIHSPVGLVSLQWDTLTELVYCVTVAVTVTKWAVQLRHNNAPAHSTALVQAVLVKHHITQVCLAPCDFWLLPKLKSPLKGRFVNVTVIQYTS